jgi:hypothetical protein
MTEQHKPFNMDQKRRRSDQEKIEAFFALEHEFDQKMLKKEQQVDLWKTEMADLGWL